MIERPRSRSAMVLSPANLQGSCNKCRCRPVPPLSLCMLQPRGLSRGNGALYQNDWLSGTTMNRIVWKVVHYTYDSKETSSASPTLHLTWSWQQSRLSPAKTLSFCRKGLLMQPHGRHYPAAGNMVQSADSLHCGKRQLPAVIAVPISCSTPTLSILKFSARSSFNSAAGHRSIDRRPGRQPQGIIKD